MARVIRFRRSLAAAVLLLSLATGRAAQQGPAPATAPTWGQEPLETISATRARVCLNGLWRFMPATGESAASPTNDWGLIWVPGTWATPAAGGAYSIPSVATRGKGPSWKGLEGGRTTEAWNALERAWYERPLAIPRAWAGRCRPGTLPRS